MVASACFVSRDRGGGGDERTEKIPPCLRKADKAFNHLHALVAVEYADLVVAGLLVAREIEVAACARKKHLGL